MQYLRVFKMMTLVLLRCSPGNRSSYLKGNRLIIGDFLIPGASRASGLTDRC